MILRKLAPAFTGLGLVLLFGFIQPVAAQRGSVTGTVTDRNSGQPVTGVQVHLEGTTLGAITGENGRYAIQNVPSGTYQVVAQFIGYSTQRRENVRIGGEPVVIDFAMPTSVLTLQEVVVTGVSDPTAGVKSPVVVGKLSADQLAVPANNATEALQGKIAGVKVVSGSGQPGDAASVVLRGAKSVTKSSAPLYVVDGVILSSSTIDLNSTDIESIEVVKGAAAASMYGSRAANGVINITTKRGRTIQENDTRITVRSEYGVNELPKSIGLTKSHFFKVDPTGAACQGVEGAGPTCFVDEEGKGVERTKRVENSLLDAEGKPISGGFAFADQPFGRVFDQLDRFFDPGDYRNFLVTIGQNSRATNFYASFSDELESGAVMNNGGFARRSARLNVDHRLRDDVNFSVSTFYSRGERDDIGGGGNPFYGLMFMTADQDLTELDEDGTYKIQPDPLVLEDNPLYGVTYADLTDYRSRFLGAFDVKYSPLNWLSFESNLSYDRSNRRTHDFYNKGFKSIDNSTVTSGLIRRPSFDTEGINGSVTGNLLRSFGDLTTRGRVRYLAERETYNRTDASGWQLAVPGVQNLGTASEQSVFSLIQEVRSNSYFGSAGLDYAGKYILDGLIRRDGVSLFGEDSRWNNYYRGSGAWRMSQESWWPAPEALNEFKLRYSIGTAGNRPDFRDQFETWNVSSGNVSKGNLGNANLKPEHATEQEYGIDMIAFNRFQVQLTRAESDVRDLLLNVPLPALFGYGSQWRNAGRMESNTWEASVEAAVLQKGKLNWTTGLVFDRTRQKISELNVPCYRYGPEQAFYICEDEPVGVFYGYKFATGINDLPEAFRNNADAFQVNDDGYLVAVGSGNTFREGMSKTLWGSKVDVDGDGKGDYSFGMPIVQKDEEGQDKFQRIGDSNADFNLGWSNSINLGKLSIFGLFDAQVGGDIYNNTRQWSFRELNHGQVDQAGKADELKKPVVYYSTLYNVNRTNSEFVEDATYVKFREMSVRYSFDKASFGFIENFGASRITLGILGRNLITWSDYSGFDPEVGANRPDLGCNSAAICRFDGFGYPNFRTFAGSVEVEF